MLSQAPPIFVFQNEWDAPILSNCTLHRYSFCIPAVKDETVIN